MTAVTQQQLNETLELFGRYDDGGIEYAALIDQVNDYAARILSEQNLINFNFTQVVTGRFRVRATGHPALTPLGQKALERLKTR